MSALTSIASAPERVAAAWSIRQRRRARLHCHEGHEMEERHASHIGSWRACIRCGLIDDREDIEARVSSLIFGRVDDETFDAVVLAIRDAQ